MTSSRSRTLVVPGDELCQLFQKQARRTWRLLARARRIDYQIQEETITDLNVMQLRELRSPAFVVHGFNKRREARTGADWEWWFGGRGKPWLGFRVQAKVLRLDDDTFPHLHYHGKSGPQCDLLIKDATKNHPKRIPLYCLYLHAERSSSRRIADRPIQLTGCSVISAFEVKRLSRQNEIRLDALLGMSSPWHRLVCDTSSDAAELAYRVWHSSRTLLEPSRLPVFDDSIADRSEVGQAVTIEPSRDVPSYVITLGEGGAPQIEDPALASVSVFATLR